MSMKQPLVYIVLLNWNNYHDTIECIEMLKKITYKNYRIILVDNASTNESVALLKKRYPQIFLIENKENLGFSGVNVGIEYALVKKADYILLLNNDTVVDKKFLSELVRVSESNEKIGLASSLIYYYHDKDKVQSAGGFINYKGSYPFIDPNWQKRDSGQFKENIFTDTLIGCSLLVKRSVFEKVGLFDTNLFIYADDTELSIRAKKNRFLLCSVVTSKVWHKVSASSGGREHNLTYLYYNTRNIIYFSKKHLHLLTRISFNYYFLLGRLHEVYRLFMKKQYKACRAMIYGLLHGYIGKTGYFDLKKL